MKTIYFVLLLMLAGFVQAQSASTQTAEFIESSVTVDTGTGRLEGTLLSPEKEHTDTVVLIIAGSGPTDRDGNNPYIANNALKLLAEGLAEFGVSSLRYDKRGVGGSADAIIKEQDLRFDNYIDDAQSWVDYLHQLKIHKNIVIAGHSEGALIGTIVSKHSAVNKFVSLSGPGQSVDKILQKQLNNQPTDVQEMAAPFIDALAGGETVDDVPVAMMALFRPSVQPFLISLFQYDPKVEISKLEKPVLIVQGTTDIQISVEDANLLASGNNAAQLEVIDGMNHIFKTVVKDQQLNLQTYNKPDLPIHEKLVPAIVKFVED